MLRHPCGSRVINEVYTAASTKQRRALTAEFYGREAVLFHEASSLSLGFPASQVADDLLLPMTVPQVHIAGKLAHRQIFLLYRYLRNPGPICVLHKGSTGESAHAQGAVPLLQDAPQGLREVLDKADATGKLRIVQQMSINIIPIIEKGLLDPVITHGCVCLCYVAFEFLRAT